jgi:hypothetical protein
VRGGLLLWLQLGAVMLGACYSALLVAVLTVDEAAPQLDTLQQLAASGLGYTDVDLVWPGQVLFFFWSLFCNFLILIIEVGAVGRRERAAAAGTLRHVQLVAPPAAAAALRTLHLHGRVSRLGIPLSAGTAAP